MELKKLIEESPDEELKTPLHPRIEWFYNRYKEFYDNHVSIKSLPDEDDPRYRGNDYTN